MFYSKEKLEKFLIPVKEIERAKESGSFMSLGSHGYSRGELSEAWQNRKVVIYVKSKVGDWRRRRTGNMDRLMYDYRKELEILTWFHHENIILLIGFCDEYDEMVMVCEDVNASLVEYHCNRDTRHRSWGERLKICIGIAKGLSYLHSGGVGEVGRVIHKDLQSKNIMLDENLVPKISGFGDSVLFHTNQPYAKINASASPRNDRDPIYHETGLLNTQTDIYSYGIVMFEMLIGMVADQERIVGDYKPQTLINIVRRCYDDRHEQLIDPSLRDHIDRRSFNMFTEIAYKCISFNIKDRPKMDEIVKTIEEALDIHNQGAPSGSVNLKLELQKKFLIPLEEIIKATSDFQEITENRSFSKLYRGYLNDRWKKSPVAIKKCTGSPFEYELMLISRLHHENIIPFVGYCDEDGKQIIVYEWADNGSVLFPIMGSAPKDLHRGIKRTQVPTFGSGSWGVREHNTWRLQ
nr:protein kinase, ATP binding site-containing protein [Tanacetum cinerariifolium]